MTSVAEYWKPIIEQIDTKELFARWLADSWTVRELRSSVLAIMSERGFKNLGLFFDPNLDRKGLVELLVKLETNRSRYHCYRERVLRAALCMTDEHFSSASAFSKKD